MKEKVLNFITGFDKKGKARTALWICVITAVFGAVLLINCLTPMLADDFYYKMNQVFGENRKVTDLSDVFTSAVNSYMGNSGRTLTFLMYHLFFSMDKMVFNVANSLAYMLVTYLLYLIIRGNRKNSLTLYILVHLSLWIFSPEYGQDVFWMSGAINYLFPLIPIFSILYIYRRHTYKPFAKDSMAKCAALFILGLIAGWQLENSSFAVPVVTLLYIIYYKKQNKASVPKWAISGFVGGLIGYALLVAAPGNYCRLNSETASVSLSLPFRFAMISYYWIMFMGVLSAVLAVGLIINKATHKDSADFRQALIFALAALASAFCMIAAPTSPERTWFVTAGLLTAACGIVFDFSDTVVSSPSVKAAICAAALVFLGASVSDTAIVTYETRSQFLDREAKILEAKNNGETSVEVSVYSHKYPFKSNHEALYGLYDAEVGENAPNSFNMIIAEYYGVDCIIGVQ